jgi:NAD(P)-dependent dehydrogenase (short-subunit alcohol dehydrogenase family)
VETDLKRFVGRHVVVTGAGSPVGIGRGIAHRFAAEGGRVTVADVDPENGHKVAEEIAGSGGTAQFVFLDVSREDSIEELVQQSTRTFGPINVAVSNAGISGTRSTALEISAAEWDRVYGVNVRGSFMFCRACANNMMDHEVHGSIITIASTMGRSVKSMSGAYASSKAAVIMFTRSLAKALAPMNIRVNSVAPGMVASNLYRPIEGENMMERDSFVPWIIEQCIETGQLLIPREGRPEDMAAAVAFLASKDAAYITAQCLCVDGGMDWSW